MKVNIIGDWFNSTGYANHTRQFAIALNKLVSITVTTNKNPNWTSLVTDEEYKMLSGNADDCDVNIMIGMPQYWRSWSVRDKPFIGFCVWEGNKVPKDWFKNMIDENVKQIWVPSLHTRTAIINTIKEFDGFDMVLKKIRIVPHGVNTDIFKYDITKKQKPFIFTANKGWRGGWLDRGGLAFLFKSFNEEFSIEDNVELLVKINSVYAQINLQDEMNKLKLLENRAPIKITPENLSYEMLPQFYSTGDVFISPSMAESYNLPCIEAMSCGIPVITSDFGGQTDYVSNVNGWLLKEGELFEVKHEIMYEGISWVRPSNTELRRVMRYVYNNRDEVKSKGLLALETAKNNTWNHSAKIALDSLNELI